MRILLTLLALLLGPAMVALGQDGRGLATSDAVVVTVVTAIVIGGLILYEYVRVHGRR